MVRPSSVAVGEGSEKRALEYLLAQGLRKIAGNFRCRMGEIDLIMLDRECLVFVEVRYRRKNRFATAAASVDGLKQRKILRAAAAFLSRNPRFRDAPVRFDVVALDAASDDQCTLQWLKDAFRAEA